jgi:hypothetical protein
MGRGLRVKNFQFEIGKLYSLIDKSGRMRYPIFDDKFDDKRIFIRYLGVHEIILIVKKKPIQPQFSWLPSWGTGSLGRLEYNILTEDGLIATMDVGCEEHFKKVVSVEHNQGEGER